MRKPLFLMVIILFSLPWLTPPLASADTTVFAAASLRNALDELQQNWAAQKGARVVVSYAGSSALARQIEKGAPADIFISADTDWMDYLAQRKLINKASRVNLLRNELVLVVPAASRAGIELKRGAPIGRLLGNGRLSIADPEHVPAGKYARAALEALDLWPQVSGRLARGENVRAALNFVARGETPLGIVYRTDAVAEPRVRLVAVFPGNTHPPIVYPGALLVSSRNADAAVFFTHLQSAAAGATFRKHGFLTY